jgi:hypothetical protein
MSIVSECEDMDGSIYGQIYFSLRHKATEKMSGYVVIPTPIEPDATLQFQLFLEIK